MIRGTVGVAIKERIIVAVTAALLMIANVGPNGAAAEDRLTAKLDRLAKPYLDEHRVVGMVLGVVQQDATHVLGYGQLSATDKRVPDSQTIYEIGSISKVFTGILLADAVTRQVVTLQDSINKWLPPDVQTLELNQRPIRLIDLATHVSGLPRLPSNLVMTDPENPYATYQEADLVQFLRTYKLEREPGTKFEYSNLGQGLLGVLLANAEHSSYPQLLAQRITQPLNMSDTTVELSVEQQQRLAPPHLPDGQPTKNWDLPGLTGAGGIRSTCADLLLFAQACLHPPDGELGASIDLAWQVHQPPLAAEDFAMGLGWHIARDGSTRWHNGQTGGYHSMMFINRELKIAVVLLTNSATGDVDALAEDVVRMLAGAEVEPRKFEQEVEVSDAAKARYVGTYELAPGFQFTVSKQDGRLYVGLTGQPTFEVYARSETEWFYKVVEATITFKMDDAGQCTALELFQNGVRREARRVAP